MSFFTRLRLSITSPSSYGLLIRGRAWQSWGFFLAVELVWVAALTIAVTVALAAFLNVARISDAVLKAYPDALSLTLSKDGFLSVNQELPYVIDMPLPWRSSSTDDAQSLIIFDSDANVQGVRDVLDRHTLALATETTLYMREQREGVESMRAYPYPKPTQEIVVDESHLQSFFDAVKHHWIVRSHLLVILPAIFIGIVVFIGVTLWTILWLAVLVAILWGILGILGQSVDFATLYRIGLHSVALVAIVVFIASVLGIPMIGGLIPALVLLAWISWVVSVADVSVAKKTTVHTAKKRPTKKVGRSKKK